MRRAHSDDRTAVASAEEWLESPYLHRAAVRVAHQYGLAANDVADLLQELRIALWEAGPEVRVGAAWVFRVASHKAVDLLRRTLQSRRRERAFAHMAAPAEHDQELDHLLRARVDRLPARLREFYELHYLQGRSEREIAQRLGLCRSSVRWLDRSCRRSVAGRSSRPPRRHGPGSLS